jgi:hypothetical protein
MKDATVRGYDNWILWYSNDLYRGVILYDIGYPVLTWELKDRGVFYIQSVVNNISLMRIGYDVWKSSKLIQIAIDFAKEQEFKKVWVRCKKKHSLFYQKVFGFHVKEEKFFYPFIQHELIL